MKKRLHLVCAFAAMSLALAGCGNNSSAGAGKLSGEASSLPEIAAAVAKARTSHIDLTIDVAGQKMSAVGDIDAGSSPAKAKAALSIDPGTMGPVEFRLVDQVAYIKLGALSDNKFARIDLKDSDNPMGRAYGKAIEQFDPNKMIEQFKDASSMKKKGEPVQIDGVEAQPYEIVVDTSKVARHGKHGKDGMQGMRGGVPKEVVLTAYIGHDNLPRRITTDVSGSTATVNFSKWGDPVDIEAPPKAEITDGGFLDHMGRPPERRDGS